MKNWYIVQTFSGFEQKVSETLKDMVKKQELNEKIEDILVPMHEVTEVKRGKRVQRKKKYFPSYVLVKMEMSKELYHMIKNIQKVTGFLGGSGAPTPVSENEIDKIAIIKKDKNIIPNDLKLDFKLSICLVAIIKEAKIQNCVRKIIGTTNSGVTAKNLINPGACAYPTPINIFLNDTLVSLSGKSFTPITKINIAHINHVIIAVKPDIPIAVFIIVFAATAPATPSKIITSPAKYIPASPKYLFSLYRDLSNLMDLTIIFKN